MTKNFDFLSFTYMHFTWEMNPACRYYKTDTLPPPYHSLTETHCATQSIVYIKSNKDDQIVNTL